MKSCANGNQISEIPPGPPLIKGGCEKILPHPTIIVVREAGGDERGQHRREKTLKKDSTLFPQRGAGCFFPPEARKQNCLMMPSESPPASRTGEGHERLSQVLQFVTRTNFSQLQGGWGDLRGIHSYRNIPFLVPASPE
jgi:hypothetical protein